MPKTFEQFINELKLKKIAVIGAGVSNIPLIKMLTELNYDITLFDKREKEQLNEDIQKLITKEKGIKLPSQK